MRSFCSTLNVLEIEERILKVPGLNVGRCAWGAGVGKLLSLLCVFLLLLDSVASDPQCPLCPPPPANCQFHCCPTQNDCYYSVDFSDKQLLIKTEKSKYAVKCQGNESLDSESLPRFDKVFNVRAVVIRGCMPPTDSYAETLQRLGLCLLPRGRIHLANLPPGAKLQDHHFRGLETLNEVIISCSGKKLCNTSSMLLQPLSMLTKFVSIEMSLSLEALRQLPRSLRSLMLHDESLEIQFLDLPELLTLTLNSPELHPLHLTLPSLRTMAVRAPTLPLTELTPSPKNLILENIQNVTLTSKICGSVSQLYMVSSFLTSLPPDWLAACRNLKILNMKAIKLRALPAHFLRGATTLRELKLSIGKGVTSPPPDLLHYSKNLIALDLSHNGFTSLPDEMFCNSSSLQKVDLSYNKLHGEVNSLLCPLNALSNSLRELHLDHNPLGDLCPVTMANNITKGNSPLSKLTRLERLTLSAGNLTHICPDWQLQRLIRLNLSYNNIATLESADLILKRESKKVVLGVSENNLEGGKLSEREYLLPAS